MTGREKIEIGPSTKRKKAQKKKQKKEKMSLARRNGERQRSAFAAFNFRCMKKSRRGDV